MGPFGSEEDADGSTRNKSSWYKNYTRFTNSSNPWFAHGGNWDGGTGSGILAFSDTSGGAYANSSYRIVLTPTK